MQPCLLRCFLAAVAGAFFLLSSARAQTPQESGTQRATIPKKVGFLTPHPPYPLEARRNRWEATGVLEVTFDAQGNATKAVMVKTTGSMVFDAVAMRYAEAHWKNLTGKPQVLRTTLVWRLHR